MATLIEFLLARIAEDEEVARAAIQPDQLYPWGDRRLPQRKPEDFPEDVRGYLGGTWGEHCARWSPLQVLAECEAKRLMIEFCQTMELDHPQELIYLGSILSVKFLLLPYEDHPDYQQEWAAGWEEEPPPLAPGISTATNTTGKPERILTDEQWRWLGGDDSAAH